MLWYVKWSNRFGHMMSIIRPISSKHCLFLMGATGMPQTLPVFSVRGRNTLCPHQRPITGHTPLTHTHTEGAFSASTQTNLHAWLWEETDHLKKTHRNRKTTVIVRAVTHLYQPAHLENGELTETFVQNPIFTGRIQTYICQRSNSRPKQRGRETCQCCYITDNTREQ